MTVRTRQFGAFAILALTRSALVRSALVRPALAYVAPVLAGRRRPRPPALDCPALPRSCPAR